MPLEALTRCWARSAGISGGEIIYTGCTVLIKIYSALSVVIGGRDGVDGGGVHWMTHAIYKIYHLSRGLAFGGGFGWGKSIFRVYYTNNSLSCSFLRYWGTGWDGCGRDTLDDVFYK